MSVGFISGKMPNKVAAAPAEDAGQISSITNELIYQEISLTKNQHVDICAFSNVFDMNLISRFSK